MIGIMISSGFITTLKLYLLWWQSVNKSLSQLVSRLIAMLTYHNHTDIVIVDRRDRIRSVHRVLIVIIIIINLIK